MKMVMSEYKMLLASFIKSIFNKIDFIDLRVKFFEKLFKEKSSCLTICDDDV